MKHVNFPIIPSMTAVSLLLLSLPLIDLLYEQSGEGRGEQAAPHLGTRRVSCMKPVNLRG